MQRLIFNPRSAATLRGRDDRWTTYQDALVPALELRISPRGARSWSVRCRVGGRRLRVSLGNVARVGLAAARARAREVLEQAATGEDPRRTPTGRLTVAALAKSALEALELSDATRTEWERLLDVEVAPKLGTLAADQLDRRAIRRWSEGIRSKAVARHAFAFLRRCYSWAVRSEALRASPFVDLPGPAPLPAATRVLTTDELRHLWVALGTLELLHEQIVAHEKAQGWTWERPERAYIDATRLLVYTLTRRRMVIGMQASELEALDQPATARWIVPAARMKSKRDHVVPLSPQALAIVKRRLDAAGKGELLFPAGRGASGPMTWSSRFVADLVDLVDRIAERPLPRWTIHNLRHTGATHMVEDLGVSSEVVSLILAHRPPGAPVTRVYNRAERLPERRDALNRWASWVEALA